MGVILAWRDEMEMVEEQVTVTRHFKKTLELVLLSVLFSAFNMCHFISPATKPIMYKSGVYFFENVVIRS